MSQLNDLRTQLAASLDGLGLTVVTEVSKLHPPCVYVGLPPVNVTPTGGGVHLTALFPVWLIAPGTGNDAAAAWILDALEVVMVRLREQNTVTDADPGPYGESELPAYKLNITRTLRLETS